MRLEEIGFYTLEDARARNVSVSTPLWRCELILTDRCNFKCPYCRGVEKAYRGDLDFASATATLGHWFDEGLKNVRFSGGEPTLYPRLDELVRRCRGAGVERIALSTSGSADTDYYKYLRDLGINDFSISLDACCSESVDKMTGIKGSLEVVVSNIRELSKSAYVTVGVVYNNTNKNEVGATIMFLEELGVSDIRIIPAAQFSASLGVFGFEERFPILRYRLDNFRTGRPVRGIGDTDNHKCPLVLDDMAVMKSRHWPCIIYLREGGDAIGDVGPQMREQRRRWYETHDCYKDKICRHNCLDVCVDYNNRVRELQGQTWSQEVKDEILQASSSTG